MSRHWLLLVAFGVQLLLFGALVFFAVRGFPFLDGPSGRDAVVAPRATADRFDGPRAFELLRQQVAVGQRPAGSPQLRGLAERLRAQLPSGRFEDVPGHPGLRNVVGVLPGRTPAIVVGAHYDSEAQPRGFVGANDSAAGTAAVVELSRALARDRPPHPREVRFVLLDGEEEPAGSDDFLRDGLRGSRAYVARHRGEIEELVLLDYIANEPIAIPREAGSDRALWGELRAAADRVGVQQVFPDATRGRIFDDHTPFTEAGIRAIDLIDFGYPQRDTVDDDLDHVRERSLDAVGEAVTELVATRQAR